MEGWLQGGMLYLVIVLLWNFGNIKESFTKSNPQHLSKGRVGGDSGCSL